MKELKCLKVSYWKKSIVFTLVSEFNTLPRGRDGRRFDTASALLHNSAGLQICSCYNNADPDEVTSTKRAGAD